MSLSTLLSMFSSGDAAKVETDFGTLFANVEKIVGDVVAGKGSVISTVVGLAEDIGTIKTTLADFVLIATDIKALLASAASAPAASVVAAPVAAPASVAASVALPSAATVAAAPATSVLAKVEAAVKSLDPFAPKPLAPAAHVSA